MTSGETQRDGLVRFLLRATIAALGLGLATKWVSGVSVDGPGTLLLGGLLLGVVNAVVRPIAIVLTLPFTFITLGLFLLVVNAGMLALTAWLIQGLRVASFGAAFWASIIVSVVSWVGSWVIGPRGKLQVSIRRD
jgi:putative membrane protein